MFYYRLFWGKRKDPRRGQGYFFILGGWGAASEVGRMEMGGERIFTVKLAPNYGVIIPSICPFCTTAINSFK
jgi:hypothetical protein